MGSSAVICDVPVVAGMSIAHATSHGSAQTVQLRRFSSHASVLRVQLARLTSSRRPTHPAVQRAQLIVPKAMRRARHAQANGDRRQEETLGPTAGRKAMDLVTTASSCQESPRLLLSGWRWAWLRQLFSAWLDPTLWLVWAPCWGRDPLGSQAASGLEPSWVGATESIAGLTTACGVAKVDCRIAATRCSSWMASAPSSFTSS